MGAGTPNYQKLYAMGKLPKHARKFIPVLMAVDSMKEKLCDNCKVIFEEETKEEGVIKSKEEEVKVEVKKVVKEDKDSNKEENEK